MKLKWTKHYVLSSGGNDHADVNSDIIFDIKDTKFYVPVVTLSAKDNHRLSKLGIQKVSLLEWM